LIESNWKVRNERSEFEIVIPTDCSATIELPALIGEVLTGEDEPLVIAVEELHKPHRMTLGSGRYQSIIPRKK